jgi:hypothetical protein
MILKAQSLLAAGLLIFVFGCTKQTQNRDVHYKRGTLYQSQKDFLIPRELRDEMETNYLAFIRKENPKIVLGDDEVKERIPREFLAVTTFLRGENPGTLDSDMRLDMPRGGGILDLKDYVDGQKGSFYLSFDVKRANQPQEALQNLKIYFLSFGRETKIDGENFGAGCNKFMEVTSHFWGATGRKEFQLNATGARHVPVTSGIYYFFDFNPVRKIYIAAIQVTDSRFGQMYCKDFVQLQ